jgi:hypothetical protein
MLFRDNPTNGRGFNRLRRGPAVDKAADKPQGSGYLAIHRPIYHSTPVSLLFVW